jgi:hypothetical protein
MHHPSCVGPLGLLYHKPTQGRHYVAVSLHDGYACSPSFEWRLFRQIDQMRVRISHKRRA